MNESKSAYAKLLDLFDPGGNLPEDCEEWVTPFLAALENFHCESYREGFQDAYGPAINGQRKRAFLAGRNEYAGFQDDDYAWALYTASLCASPTQEKP